jgi:hypothetical protein
MRRLLISATISALAAGMLALPAVAASAAPSAACPVVPATCHGHPGPLPQNLADLNPQPLPPGAFPHAPHPWTVNGSELRCGLPGPWVRKCFPM